MQNTYISITKITAKQLFCFNLIEYNTPNNGVTIFSFELDSHHGAIIVSLRPKAPMQIYAAGHREDLAKLHTLPFILTLRSCYQSG